MSFDIFVVTCRVTNFLPKLVDMLLFSMEKTEFPFLVFPYFRVMLHESCHVVQSVIELASSFNMSCFHYLTPRYSPLSGSWERLNSKIKEITPLRGITYTTPKLCFHHDEVIKVLTSV